MKKNRDAIKLKDGQPLRRKDLQYALLREIFEDQHAVFTDPFSSEPAKVTFRNLYVNALLSSPRSSRAIKEKMLDSPEFAADFAMLAFLTNIGRINTTMAFFPETRTALRTYHPIPALRKSEGNLQDAPRIKNMLKAVSYPNGQEEPATPAECISYRQRGRVPTTTIVNLMFIFNNHSAEFGRGLFHPDNAQLEFMELFRPGQYPAPERARLFLWLCMHFLEPFEEVCPWDSTESSAARRSAPRLEGFSNVAVLNAEDKDPPDEIEWGEQMTAARRAFLERDRVRQEALGAVNEEMALRDTTDGAPPPVLVKSRTVRDGEPPIRGRPTKQQSTAALRRRQHLSARSAPYHLDELALESVPPEPYARLMLPALAPAPPTISDGRVGSGRGRKTRRAYPYDYRTPSPERSLLEQAWHIVSNFDPLIPSDGEENDRHVRVDYSRRLKTLNRLRGKSPTPEPII